MKHLVLCLLISVCFSLSFARWEEVERADKFEVLPIRVALNQQNLDVLEVQKCIPAPLSLRVIY